jgi:coenzyme F420-reducing hydrogenase gamma subunit
MEALHLEDFPEARGRVTVVAADNKDGKKELKNKTGKVSVANTDICIGCGVCAYKCPTRSLVLQRCEVIEDPPKDGREFVKRVSLDFAEAQAKREQAVKS